MDDLLEAVAQTMAGDDGFCGIKDADGRCCMSDGAREVFGMIERRTGISYADLAAADEANKKSPQSAGLRGLMRTEGTGNWQSIQTVTTDIVAGVVGLRDRLASPTMKLSSAP